ncbi:unnamed protein product [Brugia pahangi]|uniref:Uncharacterized protein n=1 Tax=Brugia pahangi TaxID=6280 RepID=A0A0N4SXM6_BRUPA|nr:unnamed protein product [Brugia pahangi]
MHCLSSGVLNELKSEDMDFHFVRLHWFSSFTSEATKECATVAFPNPWCKVFSSERIEPFLFLRIRAWNYPRKLCC